MTTHSIDSSVIYKGLSFIGCPNYLIGSDGAVWFKDRHSGIWKKRKLNKNNKGRYIVGIRIKNKSTYFLLSRLMLMAFVGPCPEGMECCHNDGDPENNCIDNLRWDTHKNNMADKIRHGTAAFGERCNNSKMTENEVREIRRLYATGKYSQNRLAAMFGLSSQMSISKIVRRVTWGHVD